MQSEMDLDPSWLVENPSGQEENESALSTSLYVPIGQGSHPKLCGLLKYPLTHSTTLSNYEYLVK